MGIKTGKHKARHSIYFSILFLSILLILPGCSNTQQATSQANAVTAKQILGNPEFKALSYGGYRTNTRQQEPTIDQLKEDMRILAAMDIKLLRTYNVHFDQAKNLLQAIKEIKEEDDDFEMYVMLGAWIDCKDAWTPKPDHLGESERNATEIATAVDLANAYPDIVKIIAVGNEAMVKWAQAYHVQAGVILKWVNHLQQLKADGKLPGDIWITSSDNFASWGGGSVEYHTPDLAKLIKAVDYISMHTYPMHDTHYNGDFWKLTSEEKELNDSAKIDSVMHRALKHAQKQYESVVKYMTNLGVNKPVHIGETGWASYSNSFFGSQGTRACDEVKQAKYYNLIREWTNQEGISCFYFEAFDEPWKDAANPGGSENHFGLFKINGEAKYVLWDEVDKGTFEGLSRNGNDITKTFDGNEEVLMKTSLPPPHE